MSDIIKFGGGDNSSSPEVFRVIEWIRSNGFKAVPVHHKSKAAIVPNYTEPDYQPDYRIWTRRRLNVGIVLGNGLVDLDLDCPEAVALASHFFPAATAVFGRLGKPKSHILFRTDRPYHRIFIDPIDKSVMFEIRGDGGHQTVMPGSVHETEELIAWMGPEDEPELTIAKVEDLEKAGCRLAISIMILRHIWMEGQRNEMCKHLAGMFYYLKWHQDEAIAIFNAVMTYSGDIDKTRLMTVRKTFNRPDKNKKITGGNTLKKMIDPIIVNHLYDLGGSPLVTALTKFEERFSVISIAGKFRVVNDGDLGTEKTYTFYQKDDFINMFNNVVDISDDKGKIKRVPVARLWLAGEERRTHNKLEFMPGVEETPKGVLNLWTGWHAKPDPSGSFQAWAQLLAFICNDDAELINWMMHWFANIFREPMNKTTTAPTILGPQGAGKTTMVNYIGHSIIGSPSFTAVTHDEHVHGKFNWHSAQAILMHSEEALYGGDRKHAGIIKSLISDRTRILEQKGIDAIQIDNHLRLILTTNNRSKAAPVEVGDRRYTMIDMETRIAPRELLGAVLEEEKGSGPAALLHHFLTMDYDPHVATSNIKNESLVISKLHNLSVLEEWWLEVLKTEQLLPEYLTWAGRSYYANTPAWPSIVGSRALYISALTYMKSQGWRGALPNDVSLSSTLNHLTGIKLKRKQKHMINDLKLRSSDELRSIPHDAINIPDRQNTIMNMPSLEECRAKFEKIVGQPIEWPEKADENDDDWRDRKQQEDEEKAKLPKF